MVAEPSYLQTLDSQMSRRLNSHMTASLYLTLDSWANQGTELVAIPESEENAGSTLQFIRILKDEGRSPA